LNTLSCRVIQKAIRSISQNDLAKLIDEYRGHVIAMIHDCHGNHVIQRCIQVQSTFAKEAQETGDLDLATEIMDQLQFIIDDVVENIESLSVHRYGCRVVQRSIEYCMESQRETVLEAITACNENLTEDSYGNYVVQQAIVTGTDKLRQEILNTLTRKNGNIYRLSKQKYASNVVEKLMQHGNVEQRNFILTELLKVRPFERLPVLL
jgi:pumilio RNA-binding family